MSATERPLVKPRPVYLHLARIRLPLPGIVSILHRISGAALFLFGIPLLLAGVGASLASPEAYAHLKATLEAHRPDAPIPDPVCLPGAPVAPDIGIGNGVAGGPPCGRPSRRGSRRGIPRGFHSPS